MFFSCPEGFCWCSLVFVGSVGFPYVFFAFLKTLGKTKKTKTQNPYPRVGLKPFKNLFLFVFPRVFWFSLVFVGSVGFHEGV